MAMDVERCGIVPPSIIIEIPNHSPSSSVYVSEQNIVISGHGLTSSDSLGDSEKDKTQLLKVPNDSLATPSTELPGTTCQLPLNLASSCSRLEMSGSSNAPPPPHHNLRLLSTSSQHQLGIESAMNTSISASQLNSTGYLNCRTRHHRHSFYLDRNNSRLFRSRSRLHSIANLLRNCADDPARKPSMNEPCLFDLTHDGPVRFKHSEYSLKINNRSPRRDSLRPDDIQAYPSSVPWNHHYKCSNDFTFDLSDTKNDTGKGVDRKRTRSLNDLSRKSFKIWSRNSIDKSSNEKSLRTCNYYSRSLIRSHNQIGSELSPVSKNDPFHPLGSRRNLTSRKASMRCSCQPHDGDDPSRRDAEHKRHTLFNDHVPFHLLTRHHFSDQFSNSRLSHRLSLRSRLNLIESPPPLCHTKEAVFRKRHTSSASITADWSLNHARQQPWSPIADVIARQPRETRRGTNAELPRRIEAQSNQINTGNKHLFVFLVIMQLTLGLAGTILGVFLQAKLPDLPVKDSGIWASAPLFMTGLVAIYLCCNRIQNQRYDILLRRCISLACLATSILCLTSGIFAGQKGSLLASYGRTSSMVEKSASNSTNSQWLPPSHHYCLDDPGNQSVSCQCYNIRQQVIWTYTKVTCRYLYVSAKDYLILQSSLLVVGAAVSIWACLVLTEQQTIQRLTGNYNQVIDKPSLATSLTSASATTELESAKTSDELRPLVGRSAAVGY